MQSVLFSQKGTKSEKNEDACLCLPMRGLFVIADGVGGGPSGDFASRAVVDLFFETYIDSKVSEASILATLERANDLIYQASLERDLKGMASTVVVGWASGKRIVCFNVGDSRIYLIRGRDIERLTSDHVRPVQKAPNVIKQMVTNVLGFRKELKIEVTEQAIQTGDLLLLMSDGISDLLDDGAILEIAGIQDLSMAERARMLVAESERLGGRDDKSVILVALEPGA